MRTKQTISHFEVAGVNLASWLGGADQRQQAALDPEPFELYEDFCIADLVAGNETWHDLVEYRRSLQRPSLSFYVDKVARKRWLPSVGFVQPRPFVLKYAHELTESGHVEDERLAIVDLLPSEANYAAKPTHMSMTKGVWLVKHDADTGATRFSTTAMRLVDAEAFDAGDLAGSLAEQLHRQADEDGDDAESWALRNVKPGLVIEELFTAFDDEHAPPLELNIFTIWGRVWVAQWNVVEGQNRWSHGFIHRNGTGVRCSLQAVQIKSVPEWLDWPRLVSMAERLGAHKDMFRTDIFVGVPMGSPALQAGAAEEERHVAVQYVVSESEIHPTTIFGDEEVCEEGARLWIAGYKVGNYRRVPNTEVPRDFLEMSASSL